ncbi:hypothetical protein Nepgr_030029 [Nepenthes gracilis]|uniref:PLATZ transcription factor family protein n=1 Tax=Nepenthes gracilis TaxID=150966 RepID=A0AAD3Y659_NEPGR|nr:hypothetical protein Nepgr_030029 [Nepenthes gracilis]
MTPNIIHPAAAAIALYTTNSPPLLSLCPSLITSSSPPYRKKLKKGSPFHLFELPIRPRKRIIMVMGAQVPEYGEEEDKWPPWLRPLLRTSFFVQCKIHADAHKSECNMYCLDCMNGALCSLCLSSHRDHRAIQIRRSSYNDVIRVSEIQKYLDIGGIQTYIINSARIVFLNERPQPRHGKVVTNTCLVCQRSLLDSFTFCSLGCKINGTSKNFWKKKKESMESGGNSDSEESMNYRPHKLATKRIHGSFTPSTPPRTAVAAASAVNYRTTKRRKGIPHRAPLGALVIQY